MVKLKLVTYTRIVHFEPAENNLSLSPLYLFRGLNMSMTSFVENILSRPGYDKFSRPGLDLGEYEKSISMIMHNLTSYTLASLQW